MEQEKVVVGSTIKCTLGAWLSLDIEGLVAGKEYKVLGIRGDFVIVVDETGQENDYAAKLFFD